KAQDAQQHLPLLGREGVAITSASALERILKHGAQSGRARQAELGAQRREPTMRLLRCRLGRAGEGAISTIAHGFDASDAHGSLATRLRFRTLRKPSQAALGP